MQNPNDDKKPGLDAQQQKGLIFSGVLHVGLLLFIIFGLPELWEDHMEELPTAITMEIVPISEISNIKPQDAVKSQKPEPKKPEPTKQKPKASPDKPKPEPKKPEPKPEPVKEKKPEPKKEEKPKPEKKKEEKPKPEKKEKAKEEPKKQEEKSLDEILKGIETDSSEEKTDTKKDAPAKEQKKAADSNYDDSLPISISEKDAIASQFKACWNVPSGALDAGNLSVVLAVNLNQDGTVTGAKLARDTGRYYSDTYFRAAADSALRAVRRCSPLKNLPQGKYGSWREMEINFDPRDML